MGLTDFRVRDVDPTTVSRGERRATVWGTVPDEARVSYRLASLGNQPRSEAGGKPKPEGIGRLKEPVRASVGRCRSPRKTNRKNRYRTTGCKGL